MKIIALIEDGHGRLHLLASRAPDLLRREISLATGRAHLVWCGLAPDGVGAQQLVDRTTSQLSLCPDGTIQSERNQAIQMLARATAIKPKWHAKARRVWIRIRGAVRRLGRVPKS